MTDDGNADFALPRGATGFFRPKDGPLPETDLWAFRTGLYAAARACRGRVGDVEEQEYPRTFHIAVILDGAGAHVILCHAHHSWIAFAEKRRDWYRDEFVEPPPWAEEFVHAGFAVLSRERLRTSLAGIDTSVLSPGERRQVRLYGITTLGGLLFDAWD